MSGILVACIFLGILVLGAGAAAKSAVNLAKGDVNAAFWGSLKMFVLLSVPTGISVFCSFYEGGSAGGLKKLISGSYATFFWITFSGQMIALPVLILAWRKRRRDGH